MPHIIETGTDVASILVFDPQALPSDFDERPADQGDLIRQLHTEQRVFKVETGADGGYLIHAFVDEPITPSLRPYLQDPVTHEEFMVPSGQVYCAGAEYAFRVDDAQLRQHPHMGGHFGVRPGRYHLTMYRTEYPEKMMEDELRRLVSPTAFKLHQNMGCFVGSALLAAIGALTAFFGLSTFIWVAAVLPSALVFIVLPFVVYRLAVFRATDRVWLDIQRRYPSMVAELRSDSTDS